MSYAEQKAREKVLRKAQKKVEESEKAISAIEDEIKDFESILSSGDVVNPELYNKHAELQKRLENAMSVWELACMELEEYKEENK